MAGTITASQVITGTGDARNVAHTLGGKPSWAGLCFPDGSRSLGGNEKVIIGQTSPFQVDVIVGDSQTKWTLLVIIST